MIKDFHYDVIRDLFKDYDNIIYPRTFNTSSMDIGSKNNRLIRS